MRSFTARSLALATLAPILCLFVFVPGCAKQSEGERCGDDVSNTGNDDCGDNLSCVKILDENRCCYTDGHVSDSRCEKTTTGSAGSGGGGATAGGAGTGGSAGLDATTAEAGLGGEGS